MGDMTTMSQVDQVRIPQNAVGIGKRRYDCPRVSPLGTIASLTKASGSVTGSDNGTFPFNKGTP